MFRIQDIGGRKEDRPVQLQSAIQVATSGSPHRRAQNRGVVVTGTVRGNDALGFVQGLMGDEDGVVDLSADILGQDLQILKVDDAVAKRRRADVAYPLTKTGSIFGEEAKSLQHRPTARFADRSACCRRPAADLRSLRGDLQRTDGGVGPWASADLRLPAGRLS